jgi:hypothetical protein
MLRCQVMGVSLKTEKRRSHCPVFSFRPWVRRAEGLLGMTTENSHGHERRSAPPALLPLVCIVIPDHSSFSVLRETPMTFACGHFKKLKCCGTFSHHGKRRSQPEEKEYSRKRPDRRRRYSVFCVPRILTPDFFHTQSLRR